MDLRKKVTRYSARTWQQAASLLAVFGKQANDFILTADVLH
jgi:hypothetical protein